MKNSNRVCLVMAGILLMVISGIVGCGSKESEQAKKEAMTKTTNNNSVLPGTSTSKKTVESLSLPVVSPDVIVEVEGEKLMRKRFNDEVKKSMSLISKEVPPDKQKLVMASVRQQVREDFINRIILEREVKRLKISASEQEVNTAVHQLTTNLPPGITLDEIMKKRQMSKQDVREELELGIKIKKLVLLQMKGKAKTTEKEISRFYSQNKEKFKMPETVRVRHILIAKGMEDDEKTRSEKKGKAEDLRNQLIDGGNFVEIAMKHSDCPSKQSGGDLGTFSRGQMVKPFEEAAFSQKKGEIGPVVETDFGYHIIQVLDHNDSRPMGLDQEARERIRTILDQRKQQETFAEMMKNLRAKTNIKVYEP